MPDAPTGGATGVVEPEPGGPRKIVLPEPELAENSLTSDGSEVALFPDVASRIARDDGDPDGGADKSSGPAVWVGVVAAIAVLTVGYLRFGKRRGSSDAAPPTPPTGTGGFRG